MAKSRSLEEDKQILDKKVKENLANDKSEVDSPLRSLRKRLKRVQRKMRILKTREKQASTKQAEASA